MCFKLWIDFVFFDWFNIADIQVEYILKEVLSLDIVGSLVLSHTLPLVAHMVSRMVEVASHILVEADYNQTEVVHGQQQSQYDVQWQLGYAVQLEMFQSHHYVCF